MVGPPPQETRRHLLAQAATGLAALSPLALAACGGSDTAEAQPIDVDATIVARVKGTVQAQSGDVQATVDAKVKAIVDAQRPPPTQPPRPTTPAAPTQVNREPSIPPGWIRYQGKSLPFTSIVPGGWVPYQFDNPPKDAIFFGRKGDAFGGDMDRGIQTKIYISAEPVSVSSPTTLDNHFTEVRQGMAQHIYAPRNGLQDKKNRKVDGVDAYVVTDYAINGGLLLALFVDGPYKWRIFMSCDPNLTIMEREKGRLNTFLDFFKLSK